MPWDLFWLCLLQAALALAVLTFVFGVFADFVARRWARAAEEVRLEVARTAQKEQS